MVHSRLIQASLALAQSSDNEDEQLKLYKQVLELDAEQPEAKNGWQNIIWQQRGDEAYKVGDLEVALKAYQKAHIDSKVTKIKEEIQQQKSKRVFKDLAEREKEEHFVVLFFVVLFFVVLFVLSVMLS